MIMITFAFALYTKIKISHLLPFLEMNIIIVKRNRTYVLEDTIPSNMC